MRKALVDKLARGKNVQLVGTITTSTSTEISLLLLLDEASVALADFGRVMGQTPNTNKNCKKEFIRICRGKARFYTSISMSRCVFVIVRIVSYGINLVILILLCTYVLFKINRQDIHSHLIPTIQCS